MSKLRPLMAIVAVSVLAVSLFSTPAYAVSSFDDTVELGMNEVSFTDSGVFRAKLVTEAIFDELVTNSSDPECQAGYASYENADIRGAFQEVSAYTYESMQYSTVTFFWADTTTPENVLSAQDDGSLRYLGLDTSYLTDAGTIIFSFGYVNGSGPLVIADCFNGNASIMSVPIYDFALNPYSLYASDPTAYHSHWRKPLFLEGGVVYPTGYEGITIPLSYELNPKYVAMGDSFSSGEGNPPFELGTDTSDNKCHRSSQAYPRLLQNDPDLDLGSMAFVACSGAKTSDVLNGSSGEGNWGEGAQTDVLSEDTEIVTITIGGNDIGFKELTTECIASTCDEFTTVYQNSMNSISNTLPSKLDGVFSAILAHAPNAEVYVAGYPVVIPYMPIDAPYNEVCSSFIGEYPNTWGDARAAYNVVISLNDAIQDAVSRQSSTRLHYVDVENGAFEGHDGCSEDSYFEYLHFPFEQEYTAHPNQSGHQAYYVNMKEVISQ